MEKKFKAKKKTKPTPINPTAYDLNMVAQEISAIEGKMQNLGIDEIKEVLKSYGMVQAQKTSGTSSMIHAALVKRGELHLRKAR